MALLAIDKKAAMPDLDDDFVSVHEGRLVDICRELAMKVEGFSDVQLEGLARKCLRRAPRPDKVTDEACS